MLSEPQPRIHPLSPELGPLDPQERAEELWKARAELPPASMALLLCADCRGHAGGRHPTLSPVLGGMWVLSVMHQRCAIFSPATQVLLFATYWFLPGELVFCKGPDLPFSDFIWCIINNEEVNC